MIYRTTAYIYGPNRSTFNKLNLSFSFKKKKKKKKKEQQE